jgi:threonine/homoserine/homoserine lactone efflux protein
VRSGANQMVLATIQILLAGVGLGLSLAVPPGPVNAVIAVQSSTKSLMSGFSVGFGAMTADAIFLIITYYLGGLVIVNNAIRGILSIISCALLAYMAYLTYVSLRSIGQLAERGRKSARLPYISGLTIGLTNPLQITWWLSVGLSLISSIGLIIIVGFFAGILLWITLFPLAMRWASSRVPSLYRWVVYASTFLLLAFSAWFLYNGIAIFSKF